MRVKPYDSDEYRVVPARPYSLSRTLARLARFPERVDCFDNGIYRRLLFFRGRPLFVEIEQEGPPSRAVLRVKLTGRDAREPGGRPLAHQVLDRVLGATTDVRPFYRAFRNDPLLGPLIGRHRGLRVAGRLTLWEMLLQIVLSQQINLPLAHAMLAELAESMGRGSRLDGKRYYSFPTPRAVVKATVADLRRFRLSRAKAETLKGLAEAIESKELSEESLEGLPDEEAVERLTSFKGVGRWTAEFSLLRGLGRMDVFPGGDLGVIKYLALGMLGYEKVASENDMRSFAESWRPYRGLALIYAYAELAART
jgi:DNA-3-methyladenine glycosylase II